jgi:hypothetical protein
MEGASLYLTKTLPEREGMRLAAFLDSKRRTIGADTAALDNQVAEKAAIRCAEAEHTAATTAAARSSAAAASAIEGACKARQRAGLADTVGAWAVQRDRTLRREWDLSDPAQVRNAALPRDVRPLYETGDFGHASGLQTFNAELLDDPRIPPERRERLLRGLAAGEREAAARRSAEAAELSATASSIATSVAAAEALASRVSAAAAHARRDTRAANEDLTAHRAELAAMRRHEAAVAGVAHVTQEEANPWLREDTRTAVSATSPHRCVWARRGAGCTGRKRMTAEVTERLLRFVCGWERREGSSEWARLRRCEAGAPARENVFPQQHPPSCLRW